MIVLMVLGIVFLLIGIHVRLGGFKSLYLSKGIPILMPRALQNAPIPLGVTLISLAVSISNWVPDSVTRGLLFDWVVTPVFIASLVLAVWNPRWLRPQWLNYLEDEYGTVMWHLLEDAHHNPREWTRRVRTQAGLEEWAEETRKKLGYPPHPGQIEREAKERGWKG